QDIDSVAGNIPLKTYEREYKFAANADFKRKVWIQFRNEADECLTLRNPRWKSIDHGLHLNIRPGTFQLQLGTTWYPEKIGTTEVTLPPGQLCRLWGAPDDSVTDDIVTRLCRADARFGAVVLFANGQEITVPV